MFVLGSAEAFSTAPTAKQTNVQRVKAWLSDTEDATMLPPAALSANIAYRSALEDAAATVSGSDAYTQAAAAWQADCRELLGASFCTRAVRVAQLSDDEVAVNWQCEWSPETTRWLEGTSRILGWQIERFELDPSIESTFSWVAVGRLLSTAAATRLLRLPIASVKGRSVLRLAAEDGVGGEPLCVAHTESVDVLRLARGGQLRNRRVATDAASLLDIRRPPAVNPDAWAAEVSARVMAGVPGTGPLDIEPMVDDAESRNAILAFGLASIALLGTSLAWLGGETGVFGFDVCDDVAASPSAYSQCVSDLFG